MTHFIPVYFYQILFQNDPFYSSLFLPNIISERPILFQITFYQILFQNDPFYSSLFLPNIISDRPILFLFKACHRR
jgi:hypothetical protein